MEVNLTKSISEKVKKEIKKQVETKFKEQNSNLDKKILKVHERISTIEEKQKHLASVSGEEVGDKIHSAVQEAMAEKMEKCDGLSVGRISKTGCSSKNSG